MTGGRFSVLCTATWVVGLGLCLAFWAGVAGCVARMVQP
jgi:hypothetical protein